MPAGDYELTPENIEKWVRKIVSDKKSSDPFKPNNLEEYVGQQKAKRIISIIVQAAKKDERPLPSTLITGPFGQGKTSLARIMADMYDTRIKLVDAATVNKNPLTKGTYIIDEIHNLSPDICDSLNILMDNNGTINIIGCSTNAGALPSAFRSRFRQVYLEPYSIKDINTILRNVVEKKGLYLESKALDNISKRSRLNPRSALQYLAFIFDIVTLQNSSYITVKITNDAFKELGVDEKGYLDRDYQYLNALPSDGRAVGLQYLSAVTSIDEETIKMEVEPYLLQQGLIDRTPKGRKRINMVNK